MNNYNDCRRILTDVESEFQNAISRVKLCMDAQQAGLDNCKLGEQLEETLEDINDKLSKGISLIETARRELRS